MSPAPGRTARPPAIRYRPARRTDVDTLAELGARAYRVASVEQRRQHYLDHPRFTLRDVRVAELDGEVVALLVLYPFHAWVRGQQVPVTGIGSPNSKRMGRSRLTGPNPRKMPPERLRYSTGGAPGVTCGSTVLTASARSPRAASVAHARPRTPNCSSTANA